MNGMVGAGVIVEHAITGLRMNRGRTLAALGGLSTSVAVMTAAWHARSLGDGGQIAGMMLLTILVAATAISVDPRQLRAAAVLDLSGATRRQRRAVVVVEALALAIPATLIGWSVGAAAASAVDNRVPGFGAVLGWSLLVAAVVSLFTGRLRTRVTTVYAHGYPPRRPIPWKGSALWLPIGALLVWAGYLMPANSETTTDLGLTLWPGIALATAGMAMLLPFAMLAAARLLDRLPWLTTNLAGALLRARWHRLGPALLLGLATAFAASVNGILGAGLDEREDRRRAQLDAIGFTASVHPNHVVVGRSPDWGLQALAWAAADGDDTGPLRLAGDAADRVRARYPDAAVTPVLRVPAQTATTNPLINSLHQRPVGVATPELLAAIGLERYADEVAAGRAIALDPALVEDGRTELDVMASPAVAATGLPTLPLALPAVLVPPDLDLAGAVDPVPRLGPHSLLVRLPHRATQQEADDLAALVEPGSEPAYAPGFGEVEAWPGWAELIDPAEHGRLDAEGTAGLRQPGQVRVAVGLAVLVTLVGLFATIALTMATRRSDEEVIESLGAPDAVLRRLAVLQAVVATALATSAGFAVGIALTHLGILHYNSRTDLTPIPLIIPPVLWTGLVAVPLLSGLTARLLARRRRALGPVELADGLLW